MFVSRSADSAAVASAGNRWQHSAAEDKPRRSASVERRCARDEQLYTTTQLQDVYGPAAPALWQEATVEQRYAEHGVAYAAVEFEDYYGDAAEGRWHTAQPAHAPAGHETREELQVAVPLEQPRPGPAAEQLWADSHFVRSLPERAGAMGALPVRCRTLRQALQAAHDARVHLPLSADLFFQGDIREALGRPGAVAVTAEWISHIRDPNRGGLLRIDFVAYDRTGAITRYHPSGKTSRVPACTRCSTPVASSYCAGRSSMD